MDSIEKVEKYIVENSELPFASKVQSISMLSGGLANFVYRLIFEDNSTAILKYYPPYLAVNPSMTVSQKRYFVEKAALQALSSQPWLEKNHNSRIRTAKIVYFDDKNYVLIMEDAGENTKTLFNYLLADSTLDQKFIELISKDVKIFLTYLTDEFGATPKTHEVFKNESTWEIIEQYFTQLWSVMVKKLNLEVELEPFISRSKEIFERKNDPNAVLVFGDFWPSSILIDKEKELIWIIDWEVARYETRTRDLEQLMANLWIMKQSKKFDQAKIESVIKKLQYEFFGDENLDWRKQCGDFSSCNFILWVVILLNETHWGLDNITDVALKALEEIKQ